MAPNQGVQDIELKQKELEELGQFRFLTLENIISDKQRMLTEQQQEIS